MLTAILIDDETNSRAALRKKIAASCPNLLIVQECNNGLEGITAIQQYKPHIVFLDIEMPHMNGFSMIEQLKEKNFDLVFTTAYNQYAINAIRMGAFDYLVKPVDVSELVAVVARITQKKQTQQNDERLQILLHEIKDNNGAAPKKIAVATQEGLEILSIDTVVYMEAVGNYTQIYFTVGKPLLASKTLKDFEEILQNAGFFRIHNASLVNVAFIKKYIRGDGGQVILLNDTILDVARRRKEELVEMLIKMAPKI
jgi:two-component system, LytTR family, response regulator